MHRVKHALLWAFSPVQPDLDMLPVRHWRSLWVATGVRLIALAAMPFLLIFYFLAHLFREGADRLGGEIGQFYDRCLQADLDRSGWEPPKLHSAPIVRLNPRWANRGPGQGGFDEAS